MKNLMLLKGWSKAASARSPLDDCCLIVPTYRRPVEMIRLLDRVIGLDDAPGEIVIVDGSPDDSVERTVREWIVARELPFDFMFVSSPPGLTRQRNVGLDACTKDFIYFLDDDCLPKRGYFQSIRDVFTNDTQRKVGAVRGFLTDAMDKPVSLLWRLRFALRIVPRGAPGQYHHCGTSGTWNSVPPFTGTRPVDVLAGGASAYRREVFSKHRFSEFFYGYAQGEDFEMALRIGKEWALLACGDAWVEHRHADSGRPAGIARGRMAARNRYFIWKRHSPHPGVINRIRFVADHCLTLAYYTGSFLLRPARPYYLAFACGTFLGMVDWVIAPPHHIEPEAVREYQFELQRLESNRIKEVA